LMLIMADDLFQKMANQSKKRHCRYDYDVRTQEASGRLRSMHEHRHCLPSPVYYP
jgi:hypothetical protein